MLLQGLQKIKELKKIDDRLSHIHSVLSKDQGKFLFDKTKTLLFKGAKLSGRHIILGYSNDFTQSNFDLPYLRVQFYNCHRQKENCLNTL